jgi:hypothetical protein
MPCLRIIGKCINVSSSTIISFTPHNNTHSGQLTNKKISDFFFFFIRKKLTLMYVTINVSSSTIILFTPLSKI